jgi:hypothetical protein
MDPHGRDDAPPAAIRKACLSYGSPRKISTMSFMSMHTSTAASDWVRRMMPTRCTPTGAEGKTFRAPCEAIRNHRGGLHSAGQCVIELRRSYAHIRCAALAAQLTAQPLLLSSSLAIHRLPSAAAICISTAPPLTPNIAPVCRPRRTLLLALASGPVLPCNPAFTSPILPASVSPILSTFKGPALPIVSGSIIF